MLTCYDATTARLLDEAGLDLLLVGDTAAQMVLGHETTLPVTMPTMLELTAAVRRGASSAMVMADMPFGSFQGSADEAVSHAVDFLKLAGADCVKVECDADHAPLIRRMVVAGVPIVAHLGARPQHVRAEGGYRRLGKTKVEANAIVDAAELMIQQGASMLLLEAVTDEVSERVVALATDPPSGRGPVPVIGCGAGPACHGQVVVLHDLLGLSKWQPPFAQPLVDLASPIRDAARRWIERVNGEPAADPARNT